MQTPTVTFKPCGHAHHVGTCKYCQRHKAAALKAHNIAAEQAARRWRDMQAQRETAK